MKDFKLNRFLISTLIISCGLSLTACSNEDSPNPIPPETITTQTMYGNYTGLMTLNTENAATTTEEEDSEKEGNSVTATVDNDTIYFQDFPVKELVMAVVEDENVADQIVEALGNIDYSIGYTPTLTSTSDSIYCQLDPKPLRLTLPFSTSTEGEETPANLNIQVNISSEEDANYEVASSILKLQLTTEEVLLSSGDSEPITLPTFQPLNLKFELTKSKE